MLIIIGGVPTKGERSHLLRSGLFHQPESNTVERKSIISKTSCQSTLKSMTQTSEDHPGVDEATREGEHHHGDVMDEESAWPPDLECGNQ